MACGFVFPEMKTIKYKKAAHKFGRRTHIKKVKSKNGKIFLSQQ
jgi:hypothetical protein